MLDGRLVTLAGLVLGKLWAPVHAPQQHRYRLQADGAVEQGAYQRGHPGQGPALVVVPGSQRAKLQSGSQPFDLRIGQLAVRSRRAFGRQRLRATGLPRPMPLVARLVRDLQRRGHLDRMHARGEHGRRPMPHQFTSYPSGLVNAATVAVPHNSEITDKQIYRNAPKESKWTSVRP